MKFIQFKDVYWNFRINLISILMKCCHTLSAQTFKHFSPGVVCLYIQYMYIYTYIVQ